MISNTRGTSGEQLHGRRETFDSYKTCTYAMALSSGTGVTVQSLRASIVLVGAISARVPHTSARPKPVLAQLTFKFSSEILPAETNALDQ
jgi:hypothetical protein